MKRRFKWAAIGLVYAIAYGFWTMFITGGGHGNFLWFVLFILGYYFGLFFPIMGFIGADLRPFWAKVAGIVLVILMFGFTVNQLLSLGERGIEDLIRLWNRSAIFFVFMSVIHLIPMVFFGYIVVRSLFSKEESDSLG